MDDVRREYNPALGADGDRMAMADDAVAWIAPNTRHFPDLTATTWGRERAEIAGAANLVLIRQDDEAITLEFRQADRFGGRSMVIDVHMSDELVGWLTASLARVLEQRRLAAIQSVEDPWFAAKADEDEDT